MLLFKHKYKNKHFAKTLSTSIAHLYPLDNEYKFAVVAPQVGQDKISFSVFKSNEIHSHTHSAKTDTYISTDGFYLKEKNVRHVLHPLHQPKTSLTNVCSAGNAIDIKEPLDPSMFASISANEFLAVSTDKQAIYYYDLKNKIKNNLPGYCIYITEHRNTEILSIAGMTFRDKKYVAFALNSATILIGILEGDKFKQEICCPCSNESKINLMFAKSGYLLANFPIANTLKIFNIKKQYQLSVLHPFPIHHLSVSASGKFLTGLEEPIDQQKQLAHIFDFKQNKHHVFF